MPTLITLIEGQSGHTVTAAEVIAGQAVLRMYSAPYSNIFLRSFSGSTVNALGYPTSYLFKIDIIGQGAALTVIEENQVAPRKITWMGDLPVPISSFIQVTITGPLIAGDIIRCEGIIN